MIIFKLFETRNNINLKQLNEWKWHAISFDFFVVFDVDSYCEGKRVKPTNKNRTSSPGLGLLIILINN